MHDHSTRDIAHSYIRFSHPDQAKGDSLRRQTQAAAEWCKRHKVRLDTSTTLHDLGKSAYLGKHRENPDRNALAAFLKLVEQGRVPRGSYLVIENLDRLTREHIQPALLLVLNLLQAGVRIVQLKPSEIVFDDKSDTLPVMMMMVELSRGHSESAMKSERVGSAWQEKKACARTGKPQPVKREDRVNGMPFMTKVLPAWIEARGGKLHLIPERAALIKRLYHMAANGYGLKIMVRKLTDEKVPRMGRANRWNKSYLALILSDRRSLGEYQPRRYRDGKPDGPPIIGYYPAVITEQEWLAARAGASERFRKRGRVSPQAVNVFSGLLKSGLDGSSYIVATSSVRKRRRRRLVSFAGFEGRGPFVSFPIETFEAAILSCLREIDPHDILNGADGPDESQVLAGQLARVEAKITELETELRHGDVAALAKVLRELEGEKRDLTEQLATARVKAAYTLSESWGECQTLIVVLANAALAGKGEEVRLRLRSTLRRIVDSIHVVVVGRGHIRLAAAQIWFTGGHRHREFLIMHRPPRDNGRARQEGGIWVESLVRVAKTTPCDLRRRDEAREIEKLLSTINLEKLLTAMRPLE
jgi:DNA invertase Pin-like site-specific DNA recombinase